MNTIKTPRGRPRIKSVNFRSFFWLVKREASYQVYRAAFNLTDWHGTRLAWSKQANDHAHERAYRILEAYPNTRHKAR